MDNLKKSFLIIVLIIGIIAISIAFAVLSTRLNIEGAIEVTDTLWNIHFQNFQVDTESTVTYEGNTHQNTAVYPSISTLENSMSLKPNVTKIENVNVSLYQPGDYARYTFEIINEGTIDATLSSFTYPMTCESGKTCDHMSYVVACKDNTKANDFVVNSTLISGEKAYCYLEITYNDQTNNNVVYTQERVSASLSANFTFIQKQISGSGSGNEQGGNSQIQVPEGSYLITYDSNGGTGTMNSQVLDPSVSNTLSTNTYTKNGYTFGGWNTASDGSGTSYSNGQVLEENTISSNMILYAEWMSHGWNFENRESITNPASNVSEQLWSYYRDGVKVQNELLLVPGSYEDVTVPIHHYLIKDGYMHIGWYEENENYYYFSTTPGKYGWVQGFRYESTTQTIDGVTYTFDENGVSDKAPPLFQSKYIVSDANTILCTLGGRVYKKVNKGDAIVGYFRTGSYTHPLLISDNPNAVTFTYYYNYAAAATYAYTYEYRGTTYYVSSWKWGMQGNFTSTGGVAELISEDYLYFDDFSAVEALIEKARTY